jgi:hypothetical protein
MSVAGPAAGLLPNAAEQLPDDAATLKRMVLEPLASLLEERRDKEALRYRVDLLLRRLCGPRGERFDPNQSLLFPEMAFGQDTAPAAPIESAAEQKSKRRCRPHGRRRLPDNLPREARHYELSEAERVCPCCRQVRIDIGVEKSEQLDYRPASLLVIEHIVHKYACPCCSRQSPPAQVQQAGSGPKAEPLQERSAELQSPLPSAEPTPTPGPTETLAEPVCPSQLPTEQGQRTPAAMPSCRLPDSHEVVIAAPKCAAPAPDCAELALLGAPRGRRRGGWDWLTLGRLEQRPAAGTSDGMTLFRAVLPPWVTQGPFHKRGTPWMISS